jgi:hypothetical protein
LEVLDAPLLRVEGGIALQRCFGSVVESFTVLGVFVLLALVFDRLEVFQGSLFLVDLGSEFFLEY